MRPEKRIKHDQETGIINNFLFITNGLILLYIHKVINNSELIRF